MLIVRTKGTFFGIVRQCRTLAVGVEFFGSTRTFSGDDNPFVAEAVLAQLWHGFRTSKSGTAKEHDTPGGSVGKNKRVAQSTDSCE